MDPLRVTLERGGLVESRHVVHAVCVRNGREVKTAGDSGLVTFMRSAAKPFQALPLVEAVPDLSDQEVGIACASHEALPEQLAAVEALLERADAGEEDLECGPVGGSRLRHNCSGKHAGMLLLCRVRGWPTAGYRLVDHPLQRELAALVVGAAGLDAGEVPRAIDGCGVVTFALPLRAMAAMFEGLAARSERVVATMRDQPELIGGPDAVDTAVMRALPGAVAKRGAEGVLCGRLSDGTGFALKAEDGANRAVGPAAGRFLGIPSLAAAKVRNSRGEEVGTLRAG